MYETADKSGEVVQLVKEKGIDVTHNEAHRLGRHLDNAGYVNFIATRDSSWVDMTSKGIEFVEGDSFTYPGRSIITSNYKIAIINSPGASMISQSDMPANGCRAVLVPYF